MVDAYEKLHDLGFAHSVEAWDGDELVGGLYGVSLGAAFFGESMFARATDASKIAFVASVRQLDAWHIGLIDCQVHTEHLERFGGYELPRLEYLEILSRALAEPTASRPVGVRDRSRRARGVGRHDDGDRARGTDAQEARVERLVEQLRRILVLAALDLRAAGLELLHELGRDRAVEVQVCERAEARRLEHGGREVVGARQASARAACRRHGRSR